VRSPGAAADALFALLCPNPPEDEEAYYRAYLGAVVLADFGFELRALRKAWE
jgi:hypothetical protein